jgi:hypothetical protein
MICNKNRFVGRRHYMRGKKNYHVVGDSLGVEGAVGLRGLEVIYLADRCILTKLE